VAFGRSLFLTCLEVSRRLGLTISSRTRSISSLYYEVKGILFSFYAMSLLF